MPSDSNHRRSLSVAASATSRASRVTLVEDDPDLTAYSPSKVKENRDITNRAPEYSWVDHLYGLFCIKRKDPSMKKTSDKSKTTAWSEHSNTSTTWRSPWILPVYVVSKTLDEDKHAEIKIAKCTIDTGNNQGNIVSQKFVKTLSYPESSFKKLTRGEQRGGTGITGDEHIPLGAVYLTWYHHNSTRVFRDMRFLVSPTESFDLIIGARSIHKDRILDMPCLAADPNDITFVSATKLVEAETILNKLQKNARGALNDNKDEITRIKRGISDEDLDEYERENEVLGDVRDFYDYLEKIYTIHKVSEGNLSAEEKEKEQGHFKSLRTLYKKYEGNKTIVDQLHKSLKEDIWHVFWRRFGDMA